MKNKCVILISHMFSNVTGGAATYANYLSSAFSSTNDGDFDFFILTHDAPESNSNIIKVDIENSSGTSFYKKMVLYRKRLDAFVLDAQYKTYILHANSALELARFSDVPAIKIANVNDYEVVSAFKLIPLNIRLYGFKSLNKIMGKIRARVHEKKVLSLVDVVVANSVYTSERIKNGYGLENVKTIYKSCNVSLFKRELEVTAEPNSFLFVGNDWRRKGLVALIDAFSIINKKGFRDAKLTIVGIPSRDYEEVFKRVRDSGVSSSINMCGNLSRDQLINIYSQNCFLVMPSYVEALGISILEAMSCGLLVAVANRGGMTEIIDDGVNGFIFKHPTPKSISDKLIKMMGLTQFEKTSILAESDKTLLFFNSTRMINEIRDLYRDLFDTREIDENCIK